MKVVVLAGGGGTRLFPLSRNEYPKQFISIAGIESLLIQSVRRVLPLVQEQDIIIVTNQRYEFHVRNDLAKAGFKKVHVLLEPESKNTAPAITLAVNFCKTQLKSSENELVFISTADHVIAPEQKFIETIQQGIAYAHQNDMVVFGIKPSRPETGYGYIQVLQGEESCVYSVGAFKEKPDLELAKQYVNAGNYYWNSGLFLFSIQCLEKELHGHQPELAKLLNMDLEQAFNGFEQMPNISFDYAVVEHAQNMKMVVMSCNWSDVGSWDTLDEILPKDEEENACMGDVFSMNCQRNLFWGRERLIVGIDLEDLTIVDTADVLVIAKALD